MLVIGTLGYYTCIILAINSATLLTSIYGAATGNPISGTIQNNSVVSCANDSTNKTLYTYYNPPSSSTQTSTGTYSSFNFTSTTLNTLGGYYGGTIGTLKTFIFYNTFDSSIRTQMESV